MKLGKFELNGGVRYERSSGSRRTGLGVTIPAEYSDNLFSYRIGLVYKPVEAVTLYAASGNSKTPSPSSVNGACSLPNGDGLNGNCNVQPESAKNYEIAVKAEVAAGSLLLSAAGVRNARDTYRVTLGARNTP